MKPRIDEWKLDDGREIALYFLATREEFYLKPTFWNEESEKQYHEGFCDEDGMAHQFVAQAWGLVDDLPPLVNDECQ